MSDKTSVGSSKNMNSLAPRCESSGSHSREQSPTVLTANASLDHSMESLLASDLSEEDGIGEDMPGTEEIVASDESKKNSDVPCNCDEQESQMEERRSERLSNGKRRGGDDKKVKSRLSSHRERKISISKRPTAAKVSFRVHYCPPLRFRLVPTRSLQKCVKIAC